MKNKKNLLKISTIILLIFMLIGCNKANDSHQKTSDSSDKKTIIAATSGVSNPFSYENNGNLTGYDVEVVKAIFKELPQYELKIELVEFEGILSGLDSGRYQIGINNFSMNNERKEKYLFSLPIINNSNVFVVRKNDEKLKSLENLSGYKAVTEVGNSGATILEKYNQENTEKPVDIIYTDENFVKQFEQIESGKYDLRIISRISAETAIKEHGFSNLKIVDFDDTTSDAGSYILFHKSNEGSELVDQVDKVIKKIYADGTLKKISEEQLGGNYIPTSSQIEEKK